jgi:hypothetical protein
VIANTWKVTHTTTAHKHNGVLLEVVSLTADVGSYFFAIRKTYTGNLTKRRVRLLRSHGLHLSANATLMWAFIEHAALGDRALRLAAFAD